MQLPSQDHQPAMTRSGHVLALYGAMVLLALGISAAREELHSFLGEQDSVDFLVLAAFVGLGIAGLVILLSRLAARHFAWAKEMHQGFRNILGQLTTTEIFVLAFASSVGEELLFRGALLPWIGLWPQAIVFALLHIGPTKSYLPWTGLALLLALLFGALVQWQESVLAPVVAHFLINFVNLRFIVKTPVHKLAR